MSTVSDALDATACHLDAVEQSQFQMTTQLPGIAQQLQSLLGVGASGSGNSGGAGSSSGGAGGGVSGGGFMQRHTETPNRPIRLGETASWHLYPTATYLEESLG